MNSRTMWLSALLLAAVTGGAAPSITRDFTSAERIIWATDLNNQQHILKTGKILEGQRADFDLTIPATGWYTLIYHGSVHAFGGRVLVDGNTVIANTPAADLGRVKGKPLGHQAGNLYLTAGKHTISLFRPSKDWMKLPSTSHWLRSTPKKLELRPSDGSPESAIRAFKTKTDVVRAGEVFEFAIMAGGTGREQRFELYSTAQLSDKPQAEMFRTVVFAASPEPETKIIRIACPKEGVFTISARVAGEKKNLRRTEFNIGDYAVVDVNGFTSNPNAKTELVFDVDCAKQTLNGKPLPKGMFHEVNGPTQVVATKAGRYRESHDSTEPLAPPMRTADDPASFSGFSYHFELPEAQIPYLIDVEFPDDSRRNVAIYHAWLKQPNGLLQPAAAAEANHCYAKAYRTGEAFPLSNRMQHHRILVWAASKYLVLPIITQEFGTRAAAARIRISKFQNNQLPIVKGSYDGSRLVGQWSEEGANWRMFVNPPQQYKNFWVRTMIGLDRWAQLCRYYGTNVIGGLGISYTTAYWRSNVFYGCKTVQLDEIRLATLICEKYGMYFIPDLFRATEYHRMGNIPAAAAHGDDVYAWGNAGEKQQGLSGFGMNPLHPAVQQFWVRGLREIGDLLNDSPAFRGVSARAGCWFFSSDFHFSSLNYGYGDWIIAEFEKDTGLKVPVSNRDPQKFSKRYDFLTSKANRARWIAWRTRRIAEYWGRLRDALRGDSGRTDIFFSIGGNMANEENTNIPSTLEERMLESGVSPELLGRDGIMWTVMGAASELAFSRAFKLPSASASPSLGLRELGGNWSPEKHGIDVSKGRRGMCGTSVFIPAGRNSLNRFARNLAVQDTMYFRYGSNSDHTGDPMLWRPWINSFTALPASRFDDVAVGDPVVVRGKFFKRGWFGGDYYFYVVNRAGYPVRVAIDLPGVKTVTRLGEIAKVQAVENHRLNVELDSYGLAAFKADGSIQIGGVATAVPPEAKQALRERLAFVEREVAPQSGPAFRDLLNQAWMAYEASRLTAVEELLLSPAARAEYVRQAKNPRWANYTMFPNKLIKSNAKGHWLVPQPFLNAMELKTLAVTPVVERKSETVNPKWVGDVMLWSDSGRIEFEIDVRGAAVYTVKLGFAVVKPGVVTGEVNGTALGAPVAVATANIPDQGAWTTQLNSGKTKFSFEAKGGLGIYALQLIPQLRPIKNPDWSTIGPFAIGMSGGDMWSGVKGRSSKVAMALQKKYPPEIGGVNLQGRYKNEKGQTVRWTQVENSIQSGRHNALVPMLVRTGSPGAEMNLAVTYIQSDRARPVAFALGVEWWGEIYLNGERVLSDAPETMKKDGAEFNTTTPRFAVLNLKKGVNELLVKLHGGTFLSYFSAEISDLPGVATSPTPRK